MALRQIIGKWSSPECAFFGFPFWDLPEQQTTARKLLSILRLCGLEGKASGFGYMFVSPSPSIRFCSLELKYENPSAVMVMTDATRQIWRLCWDFFSIFHILKTKDGIGLKIRFTCKTKVLTLQASEAQSWCCNHIGGVGHAFNRFIFCLNKKRTTAIELWDSREDQPVERVVINSPSSTPSQAAPTWSWKCGKRAASIGPLSAEIDLLSWRIKGTHSPL